MGRCRGRDAQTDLHPISLRCIDEMSGSVKRNENPRSRGRGHTIASGKSSLENPNNNDSREGEINLRSLREQLPHYRSVSHNARNAGSGGSQRPSGPNKHGVRAFRKPDGSSEESRTTSTDANPNPNPISVSSKLTLDKEGLSCLFGTCTDMCPAREREKRERLRDLAVFERMDGNSHKTSPSLAVKKFCRTISIADTQPTDIRPLAVLWDTMKYLLTLLDSSEHSFDVVHEFLFDRMRAIRQDLAMQKITDHQAIIIHEQIVRFHILSQHELLQRDSSSSSDNPLLQLNLEQLSKSLASLINLYRVNRKISSTFVTEDQAEFYCYYVLLNLGSHSQSKEEAVSVWFRSIPVSLVKSEKMTFARKVLRYFRMGNFKCFFKLVKESTYLEACLLERYFNEVRVQAVLCINQGGYKLHPFPLADLAELLMMEEADVETFCRLCGLVTSTDDTGVKFLMVKHAGFTLPEKGFRQYNCPYIGAKQASSYRLEIIRAQNLQ